MCEAAPVLRLFLCARMGVAVLHFSLLHGNNTAVACENQPSREQV
jgi:hypothetical protein